MISFTTPTFPSTNDGARRQQPHCGTGASAPCTCPECPARRARSESTVDAAAAPAACCCAQCNCA
jgi:hypothetical protein